MSEIKLISPMLDNFETGNSISDHNGVRCCPAMRTDSDEKYIVKVISTPASQVQLDALLLAGAYPDEEAAKPYFKDLAEGIIEEAQILQRLSKLEGFIPYEAWQMAPIEDRVGYDVYLLSKYCRTLEQHLRRSQMTHLSAINLGLDLCAALGVCRKSGYLYVDLKPSNIYMVNDGNYCIGDLGFVRLDSLKYASLPDKYRSQYTAPEISDAFASLNATIDIYAVGLILYQAYNDGVLPVFDENAADGIPAPAYADYEMSEIILKACAADPKDRWQDPVEMGQALVAYMQRNGANNTPIVPAPVAVDTPDSDGNPGESVAEPEETACDVPEEPGCDATSDDNRAIDEICDPAVEESVAAPVDTNADESFAYSVDDQGNLSFLTDAFVDETLPENDSSAIGYDEVSDEVSQILSVADELISHPAPDPVVSPDPIDVPMPPPIVLDVDTNADEEPAAEGISSSSTEEVDTADDNADDAPELIEEVDNTDDFEDDADVEDEDEDPEAVYLRKKRIRKWIRSIILTVLLLGLLLSGYLYYKNCYLQPITLRLEGNEGNLTVYVTTKIDESKLTVICSDTYGNPIESAVINGKAEFTGLAPNSAYTVEVIIDGFHRLTGDTSDAYTTPIQTNIVQFTAVNGIEDGTVVLRFTVDGPDTNQWSVVYSTNGQPEQTVLFSGHSTTLTGLTVGSEYTFQLVPEQGLYITGMNQIQFTVQKHILAENVEIYNYADGILNVRWETPEGAVVDNWNVRCYNNSGYDETITVSQTDVQFSNVPDSTAFTVEVTAVGMSVSEHAYINGSATTISDFKAELLDPLHAVITWSSTSSVPEGGWIVLYSLDNDSTQHMLNCTDNSVEIASPVPGAIYNITLQSANSGTVLGGSFSSILCQETEFDGYEIGAEHIQFDMCKTPENANWNVDSVPLSDFKTTFAPDENASFLVSTPYLYEASEDLITTMYVIRDSSGNVISFASESRTWNSMWDRGYCELDIPNMPKNPGTYTITVCFNGATVNQQNFTISS